MTTASDLAIDLGLAISRRTRVVIANLSAVTFLGATGLGVLERAHHHAVRAGSRLLLVAAQRCVLRPLALTGLDAVLIVVPTSAAARVFAER
ncbi:STAS domain-containing protein [Umezawaea sp. NPDC059074]|uniref:STAS domain-containing protein n=1 Tax=Umezawaea sp. NPDC059074 TaxID=3346716 RepID=UPI00367DCE74